MSDKEAKSRGRWMKWALGGSVALNLVFIGLVVGAMTRFAGSEVRGPAMSPAGQSYGAPFVRALPREARRALHKSLRSQAAGLPSRAERRALYQDMIALLRQDTFDAAAAQDILATQASAAEAVQGHAQNGWLALVAQMDAGERAALADRLEDGFNKRGKRHKKPQR